VRKKKDDDSYPLEICGQCEGEGKESSALTTIKLKNCWGKGRGTHLTVLVSEQNPQKSGETAIVTEESYLGENACQKTQTGLGGREHTRFVEFRSNRRLGNRAGRETEARKRSKKYPRGMEPRRQSDSGP